jgi:hypothetical protein
MSYKGDFQQYLHASSDDLELLRQNWLLSESAFITFARDRGVNVIGVISGQPAQFHTQGWLASDGTDGDDGPHFHPFRVYPLYKILHRMKAVRRKSPEREVESEVGDIAEAARDWNDIAGLAILLEPIYWPQITGRTLLAGGMREQEHASKLADYRLRILDLVRSLDLALWRERHASLCADAARIDRNGRLYLLLRVGNWDQREKLEGPVSGALWLRHMAELIRRAFEEVSSERWPEEDQAFGRWLPGGRKRVLGSERPLDDELRSKPYLAYLFGLFTGSSVRWYFEGETEYYALLEILPDAHRFGIELVNLHGSIESGRGNATLRLESMLKEDRALRRFSMISIDGDVRANLKAIGRQARQDNIVGFVAVHRPDFEFANFAAEELAEVAARLDEAKGFLGDAVRSADWTGIGDVGAFERMHRAISQRKPGALKGEEWGRALAKYAVEHPRRSDTGCVRPLLHGVRAALNAWVSDYDAQKRRFAIDPTTLEQMPRTKEPEGKPVAFPGFPGI